jgi:hypothetical protein
VSAGSAAAHLTALICKKIIGATLSERGDVKDGGSIMPKTRGAFYMLAGLGSLFAMSAPAVAQQTAYGHVTSLQTGSLGGPPSPLGHPRTPADDTIAVTLDVPFVNSADKGVVVDERHPPPAVRCKVTNGGYALDPSDTGTKLNESVLLSAYVSGKRVSLFLEGCVFDKPRIISVSMSASEN